LPTLKLIGRRTHATKDIIEFRLVALHGVKLALIKCLARSHFIRDMVDALISSMYLWRRFRSAGIMTLPPIVLDYPRTLPQGERAIVILPRILS
jgi:hypothetical protein